jgi:hypothetical protein
MEQTRFQLLTEACVQEVLRARAIGEVLLPSSDGLESRRDCFPFSRARALARGQLPTDDELRHLALCSTCDARVNRFQSLATEPSWSISFGDVLSESVDMVQVPIERIAEWIRIASGNASVLGRSILEAACATTNETSDRRIEPFVWTDLEVTLEPRSDLDRLFITVMTFSTERQKSSVELKLVGITGETLLVKVNLDKADPTDPFVLGTSIIDEPYERTITRLGAVIVPIPIGLSLLRGI